MMIMNPSWNAAYLFSQTIDAAQRETGASPQVSETYTSQGILLVMSVIEQGFWRRSLVERRCSEAFLNKMHGKEVVSWADLKAEHEREIGTLKVKPKEHWPIHLESDPLNTAVWVRAEGERPGIPFAITHMPTVLPSVAQYSDKKEQEWAGTVNTRIGFGEGQYAYTAKSGEPVRVGLPEGLEKAPEPPVGVPVQMNRPITVRIARQSKTMTGPYIELEASASGQWTVDISMSDSVPASSKGQIELSVLGKEVGSQKQVEVLGVKTDFAYEKIPVGFDRAGVFAAAWSPQGSP